MEAQSNYVKLLHLHLTITFRNKLQALLSTQLQQNFDQDFSSKTVIINDQFGDNTFFCSQGIG